MGIINVEGVGQVTIAGDTPTAEESQTIIQNQKELTKDNLLNSKAEDDTGSFLTSPAMGRLVLEAGLAIGATVMSGGMALPATAARIGMLSRPFLTQLAKSSLASGAGSATGAVAAQTFDPKDDIGKEIVRAATEGALAEAIGGPVLIGAGRGVSKGYKYITGQLGDPTQLKARVEMIKGAKEAEKALVSKADQIMYGTKGFVPGAVPDIKNVRNFLEINKDNIKTAGTTADTLLDQAKRVGTIEGKGYGGLTPALKSSNRGIAMIENVAQLSLIGGTKLTAQKTALEEIAQFMPYESFANLARFPGFQDDLGKLYFESIGGAKEGFEAAVQRKYDVVSRVGGEVLETKLIIPRDNLFKKAEAMIAKESADPQYKKTFNYIRQLKTEQFGADATLTWNKASQLRKSVNEYMRANPNITPTEMRALSILKADVVESISNPALLKKYDLGDNAMKALARADKFKESGHNIFNKYIAKQILKSGDLTTNGTTDKVFNAVVQSNGPQSAKITLDLIKEMNTKVSGKKMISDEVADKMRMSLKGNFIRKLLTKSETASAQFGNYINSNALKGNMDAFSEQGKVIMGKDWTKMEELTKIVGFAQGKIDRTGNLPGGIMIQMKQSGAVSQLGGSLLHIGGAVGVGSAGALGPAAGILFAPAVAAKIFTDPKLSKLLFQKPVMTALEGPAKNTPLVALQTYRQIVGRLLSEGYVPEEDANRALAEADMWYEQNKGGMNNVGQPDNTPPAQPASLPDVNPADFPVVNAGQINSSIGPSFGNMFPRDTTGNAIASRGTTQPVNNMRTGGIVSVFKEN